jgi:hypothetical protein
LVLAADSMPDVGGCARVFPNGRALQFACFPPVMEMQAVEPLRLGPGRGADPTMSMELVAVDDDGPGKHLSERQPCTGDIVVAQGSRLISDVQNSEPSCRRIQKGSRGNKVQVCVTPPDRLTVLIHLSLQRVDDRGDISIRQYVLALIAEMILATLSLLGCTAGASLPTLEAALGTRAPAPGSYPIIS